MTPRASLTRLRKCFAVAVMLVATAGVAAASVAASAAAQSFITLASTTSTDNSGLFGDILPLFEAETGIAVRVVAVGTGAALRLGEAGDADVLLVHDRASEDTFVASGFGAYRRDVMFNDFVIVGPGNDPAGIRGLGDAAAALGRIAAREARFLSRGDDSGTNRAELRLWAADGFDPRTASGRWYREAGAGMGATLNFAADMGAYTLADRATWLSFQNRGDLTLLVEGDPRLFNPYGVILVNPERHAHVKVDAATAFIDWITGPKGQAAIAAFRIDGQEVFFPDASGGAAQ